MRASAVAFLGLMIAAAPALAGVKEGVDAWQAKDYATAVAQWRAPAAAGDADAQFNLAQAYKLGRGVPADLKIAQDWYQKAALQNHEQAQANLGLILFQNGDRKGAMPWIQKAADRGEPRAQYVLGTAHFNGDLVPKDWVKGYALMTRAAAAGLPQAATSLGQMDRYISLADRQKGIALAKEMDKSGPSSGTPVAEPKPVVKPVQKSVMKPVPVPPSASVAAKPVLVAPATVASSSGWRVQLGAFGSEAAAAAAWGKLSEKPGLKGLQSWVVKSGTVHRLQAGPLASRSSADQLCKSVKAWAEGCFPVSP
jgi:TPR repeat protein